MGADAYTDLFYSSSAALFTDLDEQSSPLTERCWG